jgi:hypothetical protein
MAGKKGARHAGLDVIGEALIVADQLAKVGLPVSLSRAHA